MKYDSPLFDNISAHLSSPRLVDVSDEYGLNSSVEISPQIKTDDVWLCTHSLTNGWVAQAHARVRNNKATFKNISDSVLVLPMGIIEGEKVALSTPFYIADGDRIDIKADTSNLLSATLSRKYPLHAGWLNRYSQIPSTRLEGCNDPMFQRPDTLFTITEVPVFHNVAVINSPIPYRYIRVIADLPSYANMDHLDIYDKAGNLIANESKRLIDLSKPHLIGRIEYFPWNDGNFIVPDHDYELVYWDEDKWHSISRQHSEGYSLIFNGIPKGALLLLHDITQGKEERPFTLRDDKIMWW